MSIAISRNKSLSTTQKAITLNKLQQQYYFSLLSEKPIEMNERFIYMKR